jgi:hypothetical protein
MHLLLPITEPASLEEGMAQVATYQDGEITSYMMDSIMPSSNSSSGMPATKVVAIDNESECSLVSSWLPKGLDARAWLVAKLGPED